ncbi:hypothetical protein BASA82_000250 [Batrachochytrium salamandrivorans]|nr:hypothetical protein BASA82_000250 [Batrachochytrium salamandrivorans]
MVGEGTKITSYLVRQGSGCTGAVLLNTPMTPSGVCIRTPTFSYKLTCGLYEQWDNFGCNGTANLNSHDYNECASPPTENFSYQYVCEDMVAQSSSRCKRAIAPPHRVTITQWFWTLECADP